MSNSKTRGVVSAARFTGMQQTTGDVIAFLEADDIWFPDKIALQLEILNLYSDIAEVFSDFALCDKNGNQTEKRFVTREYHIFNYYKYSWDRIFPDRETVTTKSSSTNTPLSVYHGNVFIVCMLATLSRHRRSS
jgi:glycosyltransferase involved in cell wall biosynthesis